VKASNTNPWMQFGSSVALSRSGNTLAVGAIRDDSGSTGTNGNPFDGSAIDSGAVFVYTRSGSTWSQQAYIKASNTGAGDEFGFRLALGDSSGDGNLLAVSANFEDSSASGVGGNGADNSMSSSGAVYTYTRSGTTWSTQSYIKASNPGANDEFGRYLAISADGSTLAVGADYEDSSATGIYLTAATWATPGANNTASDAGAAYVFGRSGSTWTQQAYVKALNTEANDQFGWSVTLSGDGNTLAVGAVSEDSNAQTFNQTAPALADNSFERNGAVYRYKRAAGTATWTHHQYMKSSLGDWGDAFANPKLTESGSRMAVGAPGEESAAKYMYGVQNNDTVSNAGAAFFIDG
jgi:hypothetical protein